MDVQGAGTSLANIQSAVAYKVYLNVVEEMTLPDNFVAFAVINFMGFEVLCFYMPETEGVPLSNLEKLYHGDDRTSQDIKTLKLGPLSERIESETFI